MSKKKTVIGVSVAIAVVSVLAIGAVVAYLLYKRKSQADSAVMGDTSPVTQEQTVAESQIAIKDSLPQSPLDQIPTNTTVATTQSTSTGPVLTPSDTVSTPLATVQPVSTVQPTTSTPVAVSTTSSGTSTQSTATAPVTTATTTTTTATVTPTPVVAVVAPEPTKVYSKSTVKPSPWKTNQIYGSNNIDIKCTNIDQGGYIQGVYVNSGNYVDAVGIFCNDSTNVKPVGGKGGYANPISYSSQLQGFNKISLKSGNFIDNIKFHDVDQTSSTNINHSFGGSGGGNDQTIDCPTGKRLAGLSGNYNDYVMYLEGVCVDITPTLKY